VKTMCDILDVARSGYYAQVDRPPSVLAARREQLVEQIRDVYAENRGLYGSPRVTVELQEAGIDVSENTVAKVMKDAGIRARTSRRFRVTTTDARHPNPVAPNTLDRNFSADMPDTRWCCDITYIPTDEGFVYLAAVIDLYSRRIVGWSMAPHLRATLCTDALEMALLQRRPDPGLLHHSDRGVQYACEDYQDLLDRHGLECSMSRAGDCYDNAVMESFWGTFKQELIYQQPNGRFTHHGQAMRMIFEYIEVFYNRRRRHSAIGYQSPDAFEANFN